MVEKNKEVQLPRQESLGWLVAVLGGQMADSLDQRLKALGLHIGLWPTLFVLWEEEGLTQSELATRCQTANYTTTRVIDALEKLALVERRKHPTSRRAYQIFLTEQGRVLEAEATALAKACNHEFLSALSEPEREQMISLLGKILAARGATDLS